MTASDVWVYAENGKLFRRVENDGWTFLNRGPEAKDTEIVGIAGPYQVILADGSKASISYSDDWVKILDHFEDI